MKDVADNLAAQPPILLISDVHGEKEVGAHQALNVVVDDRLAERFALPETDVGQDKLIGRRRWADVLNRDFLDQVAIGHHSRLLATGQGGEEQ